MAAQNSRNQELDLEQLEACVELLVFYQYSSTAQLQSLYQVHNPLKFLISEE